MKIEKKELNNLHGEKVWACGTGWGSRVIRPTCFILKINYENKCRFHEIKKNGKPYARYISYYDVTGSDLCYLNVFMTEKDCKYYFINECRKQLIYLEDMYKLDVKYITNLINTM